MTLAIRTDGVKIDVDDEPRVPLARLYLLLVLDLHFWS